jgi:hypothetical protein
MIKATSGGLRDRRGARMLVRARHDETGSLLLFGGVLSKK